MTLIAYPLYTYTKPVSLPPQLNTPTPYHPTKATLTVGVTAHGKLGYAIELYGPKLTRLGREHATHTHTAPSWDLTLFTKNEKSAAYDETMKAMKKLRKSGKQLADQLTVNTKK